MPHKEAILPLLDELDDAARISGSVNTVVVEEGRLHGANTARDLRSPRWPIGTTLIIVPLPFVVQYEDLEDLSTPAVRR